MFKKITISFLLILLSFLFIYILADKIILPYYLYKKEIKIPLLVGNNIASAKALLQDSNLDFNIQYVPSSKEDSIGIVIYSNPKFSKIVKKGTIVDLKVLGLRETYPVPDLKFKSKSVALNMLKSIGMKIDTMIYDYWNIICTDPNEINLDSNYSQIMDNCMKYDKNIVWNQIPLPNENFYKNDSITLFISKGSYAPELYDVPTLIDLDLNEAINLINESGLILGDIKYLPYSDKIGIAGDQRNKVIDQSQLGKIRINQKINLTVQQ